jgi:PAS domain S-box-containing protein
MILQVIDVLSDHAFAHLAKALAICFVMAILGFRSLRWARKTDAGARAIWSIATVVALGAAAWCVHFVAMLGYRPDALIAFEPFWTIGSLAIALAAVGGPLALAARMRSPSGDILGGAAAALGALLMHQTGMFSLSNCLTTVSPWVDGAAVAGAAAANIGALRASRLDMRYHLAPVSALFTIGLAWLHVVSMAGGQIVPVGPPAATALQRYAIEPLVLLMIGAVMLCALIATTLQSRGQRQTDLMAAMVASMTDAAALISPTGHIVAMNPAMQRIGGWRGREGTSLRRIAEVVAPAEQIAGGEAMSTAAIADLSLAVHERRRHSVEFTLDAPTGERRVIEMIVEPVESSVGDPLGGLLLVRDVTEARNREERLTAARDEAEAHSRARGRLLALASHELRTPLNGVLGMSALLTGHVAGEKGAFLLGKLDFSARELKRLLDDILEFADGPGQATLDWRAPQALAEALERRFEPIAQARNRLLTVEIDPALPPQVNCDEAILLRALGGLVDNAIKFGADGPVTVRFRRGGWNEVPALLCEVSDQGPGVDEELIVDLISGFLQADISASRAHDGLGLGLALTRRAVAAMRGVIRVESPGSGVVFTIVLPGAIAQKGEMVDYSRGIA